MRLSDVLLSPPKMEFVPVENFLGKELKTGKQRKISVGRISIPYFCKPCNIIISFSSETDLICMGINKHLISINCVLKCARCNNLIPKWFIVESKNEMNDYMPNVRILKTSEMLSEDASIGNDYMLTFPEIACLLENAERSYREGLGLASAIYLRNIFERITIQFANITGISIKSEKDKRKHFKDLLIEVDEVAAIIPVEFSKNSYRLYSELSNFLHGIVDEQEAIFKYQDLKRLIQGILDNVKNKQELLNALNNLNFNNVGSNNV